MAADFTSRAPTEPQKSDYLHAETARPDAPKRARNDIVRGYLPFALGFVLACLFVALAFQIRAGWENHREWVVATTVPFTAGAGAALGHLLARKQLDAATPAIGLLFITIMLAVLNFLRGQATEGSDTLRDVLSITEGVFLALAVAASIGAAVWVEVKRPTHAPPPEV